MKTIINKFKDFLYNFSDYILALILLGVAITTIYFSYISMLKKATSNQITQSSYILEDVDKLEVRHFTLSIPEVITTKSLAEILKSYQLIDDEDAFIEYFNENAKIEDVKAGDVDLNNSMNFEQIVKSLTK